MNSETQRAELHKTIWRIANDMRGSVAHVLMEQAFQVGELRLEGTAVSRMLPAVNMFAPDHEYSQQKKRVFEKLAAFFERFSLLG
jgi:hypothetical protein